MKKVVVIEDCEHCKFVWYYLGIDTCCLLMNKKYIGDDGIPAFCPLHDATQEEIDRQLKLTTIAGYTEE